MRPGGSSRLIRAGDDCPLAEHGPMHLTRTGRQFCAHSSHDARRDTPGERVFWPRRASDFRDAVAAHFATIPEGA